ncbi:hypothetical protein, partial [Mycoplasma marinum]
MKKSRKYIQIGLTTLAIVAAPVALAVSCGSINETKKMETKPPLIYQSIELEKLMSGNNITKQHDAIKSVIENIESGKINEYKYEGKTYRIDNESEFLKGLKSWVKNELLIKFPTLIEGSDKSLIDIGNPIKDFTIIESPNLVGGAFKIPKNKLVAPKNSHYEFANDNIITDVDASTSQVISHWTNNISNFQRSLKMDIKKGVTFKVRLVANRGYKIAEKREFKITYKLQDIKKIVISDSTILKALQSNLENTIGNTRDMMTGRTISLIDGYASGYTKFSSDTFYNRRISKIELVDSKGKLLVQGNPAIPKTTIDSLRNGDKVYIKLTTADPLLVFSNNENTKIFTLTMKDMKSIVPIDDVNITKLEKKIEDSFNADTGLLDLASFKKFSDITSLKASEAIGSIPWGSKYHYEKTKKYVLEAPFWNPNARKSASFYMKLDSEHLIIYKGKLIVKPLIT